MSESTFFQETNVACGVDFIQRRTFGPCHQETSRSSVCLMLCCEFCISIVISTDDL